MNGRHGSRRRALAGALVAGALLAGGCGGSGDEAADARADFAREFASPTGRTVKPATRWWVPNGNLDAAQVAKELDAAAAAGFGAIEVNNLVMSAPMADPDPFFTAPTEEFLAAFGWGSPGWRTSMEGALAEAQLQGLQVDFLITPNYSANVPLDVNGDGASKELLFTTAGVAGGATFSAALAAPAAKATGDAAATPLTSTLVAATAARVVDASGTPVVLDAASLVDLTAQVTSGDAGPRLTWTAPAGGDWLVFAFWQRSTGQTFSMVFPSTNQYAPEPAYTVDHFGAAGAQALAGWWDDHLLTASMKAALAANGGQIFEDSLEYSFSGQKWTPGMLVQFQALRGYDLAPLLPLVAVVTGSGFGASTTYPYALAGDYAAGLRDRVVQDYAEALSQLYVQNHILPLKAWANALGLRYRAQPYLSGATEAACDVPEGERLAFGADDDAYRTVAAAAHLAGRPLVSNELIPAHFPVPGFGGVFMGNLYALTFENVVDGAGRELALGVNREMFHGIPYSGPLSGGALQADDALVQWPGWFPFGVNFSEAWGRGPLFTHMADLTGWFARNQLVLQAGAPRVDVAVLSGELDFEGSNTFADAGLSRAGYSYDRVSPSLLALDLATVQGGVLAPEGPAYKALVVDQQAALPLATAQSLLAWAAAGLPVVVVGDAPSRVVSYQPSSAGLLAGVAAADQNLQTVVAALLSQAAVAQVATEAAVPEALRALGVEPDARPAQPAALLSAHRAAAGVDYYYLVNDGTSELATTVSLAGQGYPYQLDAWTGEVRPVALYTVAGGRTVVPVRLAPQQSTILAVDARTPAQWLARHATSSDCEVRYTSAGDLAVRATRAGTCTTLLEDWSQAATAVAEVPAAQALSSWHLTVVGWGPGADAYSTATATVHDGDLSALVPWTSISGLENTSGVGTYTTTVTLAAAWTGGFGAYLDLGAVGGSARVTVNGTLVPPVDVKGLRVDVGPYLAAGANTVAVEVATSLNNQVTQVNTSLAGRTLEAYGLLGPVALVPYGQAVIAR